jgi:hypothetical protein
MRDPVPIVVGVSPPCEIRQAIVGPDAVEVARLHARWACSYEMFKNQPVNSSMLSTQADGEIPLSVRVRLDEFPHATAAAPASAVITDAVFGKSCDREEAHDLRSRLWKDHDMFAAR